jgi:hypothetical protein
METIMLCANRCRKIDRHQVIKDWSVATLS